MALALDFAYLTEDFESFLDRRNLLEISRGPDPGALQDRALLAAASGTQRSCHLNKYKAELLVDHDGNEADHVLGALNCESPFTRDTQVPLDVEFALEHLVANHGNLESWRRKQLSGLLELAEASRSLDRTIKARSHADTLRVTAGVNIGAILVLTTLLEWPDWALADRFTWGFPLAGVVPASNIFKPASPPKASMCLFDLLGTDADVWNSSIANCKRCHTTDEPILESTRKEQQSGKLSQDSSKSQLDDLFGAGSWRAICRRCIWQPNKGKYRKMDNAKTAILTWPLIS